MKKFYINMTIIMALLSLMPGCNNNSEISDNEDGISVKEHPVQLNDSIRNTIHQISELDCKLLMLYEEDKKEHNRRTDNPEIRQLRDEKIRLIDMIMQNNSDTMLIKAIQQELMTLRNAEDYCPEYKKLMMQKKKAGKNGVTDHQAKIRDDAEELAAINCRILQTRKKIEEGQGSIENKKELRKLTDEKWRFFDRIMLIYGQNIMKDTFFRKLVSEVQEKNCNYHKEVSSLKRAGSTSR